MRPHATRMPTAFDSLPPELRSVILEGWLDDTLQRRLHDDFPRFKRPFTNLKLTHDEQEMWMAEVKQIMVRRRKAAVIELSRLIRAFGRESRFELTRLLRIKLARLKKEGAEKMAWIESLREEYQSWASGGITSYGYPPMMREWTSCVKEVGRLESASNYVEMVIGIGEEGWTKFTRHKVACGQGESECQCF